MICLQSAAKNNKIKIWQFWAVSEGTELTKEFFGDCNIVVGIQTA